MLRFESAAIERDNEVVINGTKRYMLTDDECRKVLVLLETLTGNKPPKVSTPSTPQLKNDTTVLHEVPEPKAEKKIPGKYMYQGSFCTVTDCTGKDKAPDYRIYIHCPIPGKKGQNIRNGIKYSAVEKYGAKWAGDYEKSIFFWAFPSKKNADAFIKAEKEYAKKREQ